jgi:hypothetical protein
VLGFPFRDVPAEVPHEADILIRGEGALDEVSHRNQTGFHGLVAITGRIVDCPLRSPPPLGAAIGLGLLPHGGDADRERNRRRKCRRQSTPIGGTLGAVHAEDGHGVRLPARHGQVIGQAQTAAGQGLSTIVRPPIWSTCPSSAARCHLPAVDDLGRQAEQTVGPGGRDRRRPSSAGLRAAR